MRNEPNSAASSAIVPPPSIVSDSVRAMINTAVELRDLLTDSTEQQLRLRSSLGALVESLSMGAHTALQQRGTCGSQRLVVAGSAQSGKSTLVEWLLKCTSSLLELDTLDDTDVESNVSSNPEKALHNLCGRFSTQPGVNGDGAGTTTLNELGPLNSSDTFCPNGGLHDISVSPAYHSETPITPTSAGGGILFTPSLVSNANYMRRDRTAAGEANASLDPDENAGCVTSSHLPSLRERGLRRLFRLEDEPRGRLSYKAVTVLPFSDYRLFHSTESEILTPSVNSALHRVVSVLPGSFEMSIVDRIRGKICEVVSKRSANVQGETPTGRITVSSPARGTATAHMAHEFSLSTSTASTGARNISREHPILPWLLQECSGGVIRSEREGMTSYQVPDTLCGESFIFTIPAEVVGTSRLADCMAELFGPFAIPIPHSDSNDDVGGVLLGPNNCQGERNSGAGGRNTNTNTNTNTNNNRSSNSNNDKDCISDGRIICQLIADMTLFVLTFSDAFIIRLEGVQTLDEQLKKRPPPVACTIPELVTLFQRDVEKLYGVSVASWQVIPFSGSMSHVTHDVLHAFASIRITRTHEVNTGYMDCSTSSTNTLLWPPSSPSSFMISPPVGSSFIPLRRAISRYCDVVYGERFKTRMSVLSEKQLEEIVWHHALTSMWQDSGAEELFNAVKCFESNYLENCFLHAAVSLVIWSQQLKTVLPQAQKLIRRRLSACKAELDYVKKHTHARISSITRITKEIIPRDISCSIQVQFYEKFGELTVRFWWTLHDILEAENERCGVCPRTSTPHPASILCHSSLPAAVQARDRLRRHYQAFVRLFIKEDYGGRISHLRRIIAEKEPKTNDSVEPKGEVRWNETARADHCTSPKASDPQTTKTERDHILFVEQNAKNFKATMEKELTLHLSRFNTEVINLFVAELVACMPDFTRMCERQRSLVGRKMLRIFASVDTYKGYGSSEEILRSFLSALTRLSLVELRPSSEIEVFVTGLRRSLCEDQILLILRDLTRHGEAHEAPYASRSLSYLLKREKESSAIESQYNEVVYADDLDVWGEKQDRENALSMPTELEDVAQRSANWMRRAASFGMERTTTTRIMEQKNPCSEVGGVQFSSTPLTVLSEDTEARRERLQEEQGEVALPKQREYHENVILKSNAMFTNPLWFLLAVWKEVLSVMSFGPWVLLHNSRYGALLNNIVCTFVKQQERVGVNLESESSEIEAAICSIRKEMSRAGEDIPNTLNRLCSIARTVVHEMKSLRASAVATPTSARFDV